MAMVVEGTFTCLTLTKIIRTVKSEESIGFSDNHSADILAKSRLCDGSRSILAIIPMQRHHFNHMA